MSLKIATWNVNSLKVRLSQVLDYMSDTDTDVLCLQEIKMTDDAFPIDTFTEAGLHVNFSGQKTYNGVAIISRTAQTEVQKNLPNFQDDQQRLIAVTIGSVRVINVYPGPIDDEWNQLLLPPKIAPSALANAIVNALKQGTEDVYPGDVAQDWLARWRDNPKALEVEASNP